jgi:hypothetical protein
MEQIKSLCQTATFKATKNQSRRGKTPLSHPLNHTHTLLCFESPTSFPGHRGFSLPEVERLAFFFSFFFFFFNLKNKLSQALFVSREIFSFFFWEQWDPGNNYKKKNSYLF